MYGATASGVAAAVAVAREGKHVLLVDPTSHVGGMTSGGLGFTDSGAPDSIGGIAREFYERVGAIYGQPIAFAFEPRVADQVFRTMLEEAKVKLVSGGRLATVEKTGSTIASVTTSDGANYRADVFVDATYEGDLMALANVDYMVGREPNSRYGETMNGVTAAVAPIVPVDPYVIPGDPSSGLVSHVSPGPLQSEGTGDTRVQAYTYRLCVTKDPSNRIPFLAPAGYDPAEFELLARYLEALVAAGHAPTLGALVALGPLPNGKYDANNSGFFSSDLVGGSDAYPEADEQTREAIRARHTAYERGFFHFLTSSPRVPPAVRELASMYGLCKDEFPMNGGWPPQLYVREARRMVGSYVMTQRDALGQTRIPDPVGLASYTMDSHFTQRIEVSGEARTEGGFEMAARPFPISYRALIPDPAQARNLLVPVCLSASHVAYGSIRMEPVFMILGHAAGAAAALAIDEGRPVASVHYAALQRRLLASGQRLWWP